MGKNYNLIMGMVVDVTGDRSKVRCYKEQYCIGTWNARSMNQGKLEVVKQPMARVNIDIRFLKRNAVISDLHFAFSYCSWGSQGKNTEVVCHSLLQWTTFCQISPRPAHLGLPHGHGLVSLS